MSGIPEVLSISCPTCGAKPAGKCFSRISGDPAVQPHAARSKAFRSRLRKGARFVVLMRHDVPEHGLKKGNKYLAQVLWSRPDTVKLTSEGTGRPAVDHLQPGTAVIFVEWEF